MVFLKNDEFWVKTVKKRDFRLFWKKNAENSTTLFLSQTLVQPRLKIGTGYKTENDNFLGQINPKIAILTLLFRFPVVLT